MPAGGSLRFLEPSAGDGAFVRGLAADPLYERVESLLAVELIDGEAAACEQSGRQAPFNVEVRRGSFLDSGLAPESGFDAAVGNPPFVRFQFVEDTERRYAADVAETMGVTLKGVSNLWIPIFLCSLNKLREGGAFAFIIPAECLTGISASVVRSWLLRNTSDLRIDLFPPGSFPDVLQEVVILSGRRASSAGTSTVTVREAGHSKRTWAHKVGAEVPTWTRYLLSPAQMEALSEASSLSMAKSVGTYVKFSVATVTGANEYFSVDTETANEYELHPWLLPLLPRIRHTEGLTYSARYHELNVGAGLRSHLLDFSRATSPEYFAGANRYIRNGLAEKLHEC